MEVRRFIRKDPVSVSRDRTLAEAADLMARHSVGALVVTAGGRVAGILTDRDIVVRSLSRGKVLEDQVKDVMTTDVATVDASADVSEAIALMRKRGVRRLPVVDGDVLVGVVSVDELLIWLVTMLGAITTPVLDEVLDEEAETTAE
jgi:CBS domain-containing protein